jgi:hypothetical protein
LVFSSFFLCLFKKNFILLLKISFYPKIQLSVQIFIFYFLFFIFFKVHLRIWSHYNRKGSTSLDLSVTLGNCVLFKSQVCNFFLHNDPSIGFHFLPFWSAILSRKKSPSRLWWKEPRQHVQRDFVQSIVWHTTPEMRHRKFTSYYRMSFNNLVEELKPILQSQCANLVWPQVKIRTFVTIVIYRLVHGTSVMHIHKSLMHARKYI